MGIGAIYATYNATYEATYEVTNFLEAVRVNMGIGKENPFEATYATYEVTNLEEIVIIDRTFEMKKHGIKCFLK